MAQIKPAEGIIDTLVLCHTREMAYQIAGEFRRFSKHMPNVHISVVYGGIPFHQSKSEIEKDI